MDDYADDLRPRASILFHVRPTNDILSATATVNTTNLPDGLHTLDFVARDGSAVAAQSRLTIPIIVCNASPQLALLGTNSAAITNGEPASLAKGTDFGLGAWAQARTNYFSLLNNGPAPLSISNWTTNGPGASAFQVVNMPSAIEAGGISNFAMVFTPPSPGDYSASISFSSDAILPQTNLLLSGTGGYTLTIASDHGTPDPAVGFHIHPPNTNLTPSISVPASAGGTQLVCIGWAMEGNDPASGSTTNFTLTVTNDATLTWLWNTNYWLDTVAGLGGSVDVAASWQAAQTTTQITASANSYYHFANWTGSVSSTNNPLNLLLDAPKFVQANFAENLATNNTPEWWLAQFGWTNDYDAAATDDAEPDGFPSWQEYIADTDPTNPASYPQMMSINMEQTNPPFLSWLFSTGRTYQIHYCDDLIGSAWITQQLSIGTGEWIDTNPPPASNRYYRMAPALP